MNLKTFEKVEESGETEHVEIREVENIIPQRALNINKHREESYIGLQKQVRKMKGMSSKKMPIVLIRQTVKIKIRNRYHQAVSQLSLTGGQGLIRCDCLKKCITNRCKCRSKNILCNSRCHGSQPCTNK